MTKVLNKILVVEDDDDIREIESADLEALGGYTVDAAVSGREAIEKAPRFDPDVVLLDVMMPGLDGPTTLTKLRAIAGLQDLPVIFVTAKAMPSEIERYMRLGALGVITKPFDATTLCDEIEALWVAGRPS